MPSFTDQLGETIFLPQIPKRIISLVPSQTETLFDLGLDEEVIGITKFCVHPAPWHRTKTRIGGTKNLNVQKIQSLQPQLIIANKEENVEAQVKALAKDFPVWTSHISNLTEALHMIEQVGCMTGKQEKAKALTEKISVSFQMIKPTKTHKTAYLIWKDPFMTVGGDTFIHDMLQRMRLENIFAKDNRYPTIDIEQLKPPHCNLVLLSTEPYPFKQKHIEALKKQLPHTKILLADGEMFSWYGSRLQHAAVYFQQLHMQVESLP